MNRVVFDCPHLEVEIDLTEERLAHILARHPELGPDCQALLAATLAHPDQVRRSARIVGARLFSRWQAQVKGGKHVVVVVVSATDVTSRHWIVTAYLTRKLVEGVREWKRD